MITGMMILEHSLKKQHQEAGTDPDLELGSAINRAASSYSAAKGAVGTVFVRECFTAEAREMLLLDLATLAELAKVLK